MLVHKRTMGVLDTYWTGRHRTGPEGVQEPVMAEYAMAEGFDPAEWWEVPRGSPLGRKLRLHYPCCTPVTAGDGSLLDVALWGKEGERVTRPVKTRQRRRKAGLLEHLLKE